MDWMRLRLAEALGGKQPVSKKLLLLVGAVVAAVVFLINGLTTNQQKPIQISATESSDLVSIQEATLFVHIVGEVREPGIYQLEIGSRLIDAVFAAGGLTKVADEASVNLARELTDGEQVIIFKIGDAQSAQSASQQGMTQISLNRATQSELEELPGVGPALAQRIIDWRSANGGFKKKEDLLNISGIGDKLFAGLKDSVSL
jgi:competence protein ComEA